MAVYDLEEQEQLEEIKTWWRMYGNYVTTTVIVVGLAVAAWQGWNWWQRTQANKAAAVYSKLEEAASAKNVKITRDAAGELIANYSRTTYAALGALVAAKVSVDTGDGKNAKNQLQWVIDSGKDDSLRDLASLRLASLNLDEKAYAAALKLLDAPATKAFVPRFSELKGDVLAAENKKVEAKAAYESAVKALSELVADDVSGQYTSYRDALQSKIDSLGVAQ